jgi:hypothetical protein
MEGGNPILEYVTYGVMGLVLLALGVLAVRSAWFFLSLLAIPLAETAGKWRPFRRAVARWGERGARRDPDLWRATASPPLESDAIDEAALAAAGPIVPRPVRRGLRLGALLGALPGLWLAWDGARQTLARGEGTAAALGAAGIGIGLVAAAGALLGGALGAGAGLAWEATRRVR